jgi:hypothetical protein
LPEVDTRKTLNAPPVVIHYYAAENRLRVVTSGSRTTMEGMIYV